MRMQLKIEYVPAADLVPYSGNAKAHPAEQIEQIKASIAEFGFNDPIAVWKGNEIIEGHGRLLAAQEMGLDKVPVVRLDDLTDEQRRAYTLVHNKLTMNTDFDAEMLGQELDSISDIDMEAFGFDISDFDDDAQDFDDGGWYGDERERTNDAYNLGIDALAEKTGDFWQMPVIKCDDFVPDDLVGFNFAKTNERKDVGIHFYVDDYQFERIWNAPEKYLDVLSQYDCILSPDFSLYMDMAMPVKIWNIYRSRLIGNYYQRNGIKVIPTVSWAEPDTFRFCFEGIPKGSIVSVSTVGVKRDKEALKIWQEGMQAMMDTINPRTVLVYGGALDFDYGSAEVKYYDNHVTKNWKG